MLTGGEVGEDRIWYAAVCETSDTASRSAPGREPQQAANSRETVLLGNFYVNYTLRGPSPQDVVKALAGRSAYVTPEEHGCVVAFDEESEQNAEAVSALAARLSRELHCAVLAVLNHDDDILWYQLCVDGELADEYDSTPGYFDSDATAPSAPRGGDARKLCSAFGANDIDGVEKTLRSSIADGDYIFAVQRHDDLARLLGIPSFAVGCGYSHIVSGEMPDGLEEEELLKVA